MHIPDLLPFSPERVALVARRVEYPCSPYRQTASEFAQYAARRQGKARQGKAGEPAENGAVD